jgi:hypothetical protein
VRPPPIPIDMTSGVKGYFVSQRIDGLCSFFVPRYIPRPLAEKEPVIATVDHAEIRGLGTT